MKLLENAMTFGARVLPAISSIAIGACSPGTSSPPLPTPVHNGVTCPYPGDHFEIRQYGDQQLKCGIPDDKVTDCAYALDAWREFCQFSEKQILNGIVLPKHSVAHPPWYQQGPAIRWVDVPKESDVCIGGILLHSVERITFEDSGDVTADVRQRGLGHGQAVGLDSCCTMGLGCRLLFDHDLRFKQCITYEIDYERWY
jgi:hypothetical protein